MSVCDRCRRPGRCCSGFLLSGGWPGHAAETTLEAMVMLASVSTDPAIGSPGQNQLGLPFLPLGKRTDGAWILWCPLLGRDGRCTDYANRPALCASYQPLTDGLCAEYEGVPPVSVAP